MYVYTVFSSPKVLHGMMNRKSEIIYFIIFPKSKTVDG